MRWRDRPRYGDRADPRTRLVVTRKPVPLTSEHQHSSDPLVPGQTLASIVATRGAIRNPAFLLALQLVSIREP